MTCRRNGLLKLAVGTMFLVIAPALAAAASVPDFCFLQISDTHLTPQTVNDPPPSPKDRTIDAMAWVCREAAKPQTITPAQITTPPPAFVVNTGDLTEYGVIHATWNNFEQYFIKPLPVPLFVMPGNHDNTWTGTMAVMRRLYGNDHYSFDKFGCHFVAIDSATPQEPLPSFEQRTLTWLAADLKKVQPDTPIFLMCHHPLSSSEFAKPYEQLRLLNVLEEHNVVLLMMGHGHGWRHERWGALDSVMGGTTSHPPQNIGYNIISVKDGTLRVAYRFRDEAKPMELTIEKPIAAPPPPGLEVRLPEARRSRDQGDLPVRRGIQVPVEIEVKGAQATKISARVDGDEKRAAELTSKAGPAGSLHEGAMPTRGLVPGRHFVWVIADLPDQTQIDRGIEFVYQPASSPTAVRTILDAGMKAGPILVDGDAIVATTAGEILRISFSKGAAKVRKLFDAGVEILHTPVFVDGLLYFSAAEKGVHCITLDGKLRWARDVGAVVYGTPAVAGDRVYVGDMEGAVHAIDRAGGKLAWSKPHAPFSIEAPVLWHDGVVYFGAWDNNVYAVSAADGSLRWKKPGPAACTGEAKFKSRYYGPADCAPVAIGDRLFVTDRAYRFGSYRLSDGEYLGEIAKDVAAIGLTQDGQGIYARGLSKGLSRYDAQGKQAWTNPVEMGRFPVAPLEVAGRVYACSNRGLLTVHDAGSGKVLGEYQVTPGLHVMAPVTADADGNAVAIGMDGSVTQVTFK